MSYGVRKDFYHSKAWKTSRKSIWLKQNLLCAVCHKPVFVSGISEWIPKEKRLTGIVHHKEYITDKNYFDDNVFFNLDNLESICLAHHNDEHFGKKVDYMFDGEGNLIKR